LKYYSTLFYNILSEHYANGYLNESSLLWSEGRSDWMHLSSIPELLSGVMNQSSNLQTEGTEVHPFN
jgi:HIV Tat-specific factor 1